MGTQEPKLPSSDGANSNVASRFVQIFKRRSRSKEEAGSGRVTATQSTSAVSPRLADPRLSTVLGSKAAVEAVKLPGRWVPGLEEGEAADVWLNQEPEGGPVMEVKVKGTRGEMAEGQLPQPTEAACFSHSPPDQALHDYNAKRITRFERHLKAHFEARLGNKVADRVRHFARIHKDGLSVPRKDSVAAAAPPQEGKESRRGVVVPESSKRLGSTRLQSHKG